MDVGHGRHNAIIIESSDDDDDNNDQGRNESPRVRAAEDMLLGDDVVAVEFLDLLDDDWGAPDLGHIKRNKEVEDHMRLSNYRHNGMSIKEGTVVEIKQLPGEALRIQFLEVQIIRREGYGRDHGVVLRGIPFTRTKNLRGRLPLKRNEVVSILNIHKDDPREWTTQAAIEVSVNNVLCTRKLQFTNALYPEHRYDVGAFDTTMAAEELTTLTCRWKMVSFYESAAAQKKERLLNRVIVRLRAHEVLDPKFRVPEEQLLDKWRGGKVRGGSYHPGIRGPVVDLTDDSPPDQTRQQVPGQKYTHADLFCGAGGVTRGARTAKFRTTVACDMDPDACASYRLNFSSTDLYEMSVHEFVTSIPNTCMVDVMHISPPCQVWSPAHTSPGANDDANLAALYACREALVKLRPRVVTVEQTFGLVHKRFQHYFNLFINCFTMTDYSVAYQVTNLSEMGSSQNRKRLTILAACPGERLPSFPAPTHSNSPNALPELVTVAQALSTIGPRATLHNVDELLAKARNSPGFPKPPYDPNALLRHTITTGGGDYHPSGKRTFTLREFAALQGFPPHHEFVGRGIRKQIGNAFPPPSVKALYYHIRGWLLKEDGIKEAIGRREVALLENVPEEQEDADDNDDGDDDEQGDDVMIMEWRERLTPFHFEDE